MSQTVLFRTVILFLSALAISACATGPKPIGEWREEGFSGQLDRFLIIGVTSRSTRRRVFEDQFVEALAAQKITAIPSYNLITTTQELSRDAVERAIKGKGLGAVLVTRLIGIKQEEVYRKPDSYDYYASYSGFYDQALQQTNQGYYSQFKVLTLETNVYESGSGKLVWSMQSETLDSSRPRDLIEKQIGLTIGNLRKQGLLKSSP